MISFGGELSARICRNFAMAAISKLVPEFFLGFEIELADPTAQLKFDYHRYGTMTGKSDREVETLIWVLKQ